MKKIVFQGIIAGFGMLLTGLVFGMLPSALLPSLAVEYQNTALFRPWSDPLMMLYFLHPFVFGLVVAFVWEKSKKVVSMGTFWARGMKFGLALWVVTTIPGMLISYSSFQLSLAMILSWTLGSLIQEVVAGVILARLNH